MKSTSHFAMAHLVQASLQNRGVVLNSSAFAYGNIAPDYMPSMVLTPHFSKVCERKIREISRELSMTPLNESGRVNAEYSKMLGILCHYICDYFCFAHSKDFLSGLKGHVEFENALDTFINQSCIQLLDVDGSDTVIPSRYVDGLISRVARQKELYCEGGYTFKNDMCFAFETCIAAVLSLVAMSQDFAAINGATACDDIFPSLRGYATGEGYVFRMFFFKHRNHNLFFLPEKISRDAV